MKNNTPRVLVAVGIAFSFFQTTHSAFCQELKSIDFAPVEGTSWANSPSSVRLNFGEGIGYGTVSFTGVNGGTFQNILAPFAYNAAPYSSYDGPTTLSNGAIFAPSSELVFNILPSSNPGLSGFTMTVTLDNGAFPDGSVFSTRSLARQEGNSQYFVADSELSAPDSVQLPTDGSGIADLTLVDPSQGLYGANVNSGASKGLAFGINGNTFTTSFLTTTNYQPGGVALTIATPAAVPEPASTLLISLGSFLLLRRRRP